MNSSDFCLDLAGHPFVSGLSDEHLAILSELALPVRFKAGEYIFRRGDPANRFYLLKSGLVAIGCLDFERTITRRVAAGEVLGWSWLLPPFEWRFDAKAETPVESIFIYATPLQDILESNRSLGYEMLKRAVAAMADNKSCQSCGRGPL